MSNQANRNWISTYVQNVLYIFLPTKVDKQGRWTIATCNGGLNTYIEEVTGEHVMQINSDTCLEYLGVVIRALI